MPKRARDLRSRLEDLGRKVEEANRAYIKRLNDRSETIYETIAPLFESGGGVAQKMPF